MSVLLMIVIKLKKLRHVLIYHDARPSKAQQKQFADILV